MTIYTEDGLLNWNPRSPYAAAKQRIHNCSEDLKFLSRRLAKITDPDHKKDIEDRIYVVKLNQDKYKRQLVVLEAEREDAKTKKKKRQ